MPLGIKINREKRILFFIASCFFSISTNASIIIKDKSTLLEVRTPIQILEDKTGQKDVYSVLNSREFKWSREGVPNLGVSSSTFWVKLNVHNFSRETNLILEIAYPLIDFVSVYLPHSNGNIDSLNIDGSKPFNHRKYKHQNFIFNVYIPSGENQTVFIKLRSGEQLLLPIILGSYQAISEYHAEKNLLAGVYFGIIAVMILYNLFVFFTVRDKSYLFYVLYILAVGLTQATLQGYSFQYLWPYSPWMAENSVYLLGALSGIATVLFTKSFLHTKHFTPYLDQGLTLIAIIDIIAVVLGLLGSHNLSYQLIDINAGIGSLFVLFVAYKIYKQKYRPAKFFLTAWSIFLLSVSIFVMKDYGMLPYNNFTNYGLQIGSAIEVVLLSFALADRINILKREKEDSQAKALQALQENERIIKEQNLLLDAKVKERTLELQESNKELNLAVKKLKEAQAQLVNAEKMASVGQLTAGIAHEINNPINFISAAVKPMKRNIKYFLDILNQYETTSLQPNIKDSFKDVELLKKKYDIEYLIEEINLILQGIEDGANRTTEIVKGLRNFSRLDEAELKQANLNTGLDSTLILLQGTIGGRIKIIKDYEAIPEIECYAGKLNQVFMNILTNGIQAVKAKNLPAGEGWITIQTRQTETDLVIRIKDNGIGMSEEVKKRIFEPFFTTKDVGEGTGLGLSIVYSIIEMHEGTIIVNSQEGVGTEITITIPKNYEAVEKQVTN